MTAFHFAVKLCVATPHCTFLIVLPSFSSRLKREINQFDNLDIEQ